MSYIIEQIEIRDHLRTHFAVCFLLKHVDGLACAVRDTPIMSWLYQNFPGHTHHAQPAPRWSVIHSRIWFANADDALIFRLAWS